jgi:hypothetical protein
VARRLAEARTRFAPNDFETQSAMSAGGEVTTAGATRARPPWRPRRPATQVAEQDTLAAARHLEQGEDRYDEQQRHESLRPHRLDRFVRSRRDDVERETREEIENETAPDQNQSHRGDGPERRDCSALPRRLEYHRFVVIKMTPFAPSRPHRSSATEPRTT